MYVHAPHIGNRAQKHESASRLSDHSDMAGGGLMRGTDGLWYEPAPSHCPSCTDPLESVGVLVGWNGVASGEVVYVIKLFGVAA